MSPRLRQITLRLNCASGASVSVGVGVLVGTGVLVVVLVGDGVRVGRGVFDGAVVGVGSVQLALAEAVATGLPSVLEASKRAV